MRPTMHYKQNKFVATAFVVADIGSVTCKISWPWVSRSSVKVMHMGVGWMNSLTHKTLETN